jgi:hypothetical protein
MGAFGGDKNPMQMYHGWFQDGSPLYDGATSAYGPAPGYLEGGPNQFFSVSWVAPPYGQPDQKAYKDWNTGWNAAHQANENSWEVTEPAIYYQAAYTLLLSQYATDTYAPTAQSRFDVNAAQSLVVQFSEDIGTTLAAPDLRIDNLTTPSATPTIASVIYDASTRRATIRFGPGLLPDGNYRVSLTGGGVNDAAGNGAPATSFDFFILAGDANRDRVINFDDLLTVARNYNKIAATYADGDFNYDGTVNFADLLILTRAYNATLPAAAPPAPIASASVPPSLAAVDDDAAANVRRPVFAVTPVTKPAKPKSSLKPARR